MKNVKDIGNILKEAREKKNLSFDKVYKATHIQNKVIKALEEGTADNFLGKVYVLLFLKKYAYFLGLDGEALASDYKDIYKAAEKKKEEEISATASKDKQKPPLNIDIKKWATIAGAVMLILVFLSSAYILGMKLRSFISARQARKTTRADVAASAPVASGKSVTDNTVLSLFPLREDRPIELALRAEDASWIRVKADGETRFEGIMEKNERKEWSGEREIEIKIGKPEVLDFAVNGKSIGKIDKPNVKTVYISREGIRAGDKWIYKSGE